MNKMKTIQHSNLELEVMAKRARELTLGEKTALFFDLLRIPDDMPGKEIMSFEEHCLRMLVLGEKWRAPYPWETYDLLYDLLQGKLSGSSQHQNLLGDINNESHEWTSVAFQLKRSGQFRVYVFPPDIMYKSMGSSPFGSHSFISHSIKYHSFDGPFFDSLDYCVGELQDSLVQALYHCDRSDLPEKILGHKIVTPQADGRIWPVASFYGGIILRPVDKAASRGVRELKDYNGR